MYFFGPPLWRAKIGGAVAAPALTIDDLPALAGENQVTYTPGGTNPVTSDLTIDAVLVSSASATPGTATEQTPLRLTGGTDPGDVVTIGFPDMHYDDTAATGFNESVETFFDDLTQGSDLSFTRPNNNATITVVYRALSDAGATIFQKAYPTDATVVPVTNPTLTNLTSTMFFDEQRTFNLFSNEDETEELVLDDVSASAGVIDSFQGDGFIDYTAPSTPQEVIITADVSNSTGGTAQKTLTIDVLDSYVILAGETAQAVDLRHNEAYLWRQDPDLSPPYLQNPHQFEPVGEAWCLFGGSNGTYSMTVEYYTETDGPGFFSVDVGGVEVDAWNTSGAANEWTTRVINPVTINQDQEIRIFGDGENGAWCKFRSLSIASTYSETAFNFNGSRRLSRTANLSPDEPNNLFLMEFVMSPTADAHLFSMSTDFRTWVSGGAIYMRFKQAGGAGATTLTLASGLTTEVRTGLVVHTQLNGANIDVRAYTIQAGDGAWTTQATQTLTFNNLDWTLGAYRIGSDQVADNLYDRTIYKAMMGFGNDYGYSALSVPDAPTLATILDPATMVSKDPALLTADSPGDWRLVMYRATALGIPWNEGTAAAGTASGWDVTTGW